MIKSITFLKDHRCFKKDDVIEFRAGINLLVGEQGCGKSSVLDMLAHPKRYESVFKYVADKCPTMFFDFEKHNPRMAKEFPEEDRKMKLHIATIFSSHGETNKAILKNMEQVKSACVLMDEPDMALSIRSCINLCKHMHAAVGNKCQVIAAVHNVVVIQSVPEVLSLEHRRWMPSGEFVKLHYE